jgi:nitroreductase
MEVLEAIHARRTVRAFTAAVPPRELIECCLEAATWAPSATNQQPWEFIVATGEALRRVTDVTVRHFAERIRGRPRFDAVPEHFRQRQKSNFAAMNEAVARQGIPSERMYEDSLRFFNAPYGVYFVTRHYFDSQYTVSVAAAIENFLLAAVAHGLGACWQAAAIMCQEELKAHLGLPEEKILLAGVGVGYADTSAALNNFPRGRAGTAEVTTWLE